MDDLNDFGTGLRAHLGLEEAELELLDGRFPAPKPEPVEEPRDEEDSEHATLEALVAFEQELFERERQLAQREQALAARSAALLRAAQSMHDAVVGGPATPRDELARMRRRRSGAA